MFQKHTVVGLVDSLTAWSMSTNIHFFQLVFIQGRIFKVVRLGMFHSNRMSETVAYLSFRRQL